MIALLALVATATAAPPSNPPAGPVGIAFTDGGLGAPRRARPSTDLELRGAGSLLAAFDDFYGHLRARALLSGRWATGDLELMIELELLRAEQVISSLSASRVGLGTTSLGASYRISSSSEHDLALASRVVLPTDFGARDGAAPLGLDLGANGSYWLREDLELHAHALVLASAQISDGPTFARLGIALGGGLAWGPLDWLWVAADLGAMFAYDDPLDRVSAAVAIRVPLGALRLELAAALPIAGADRTLAVASLGARYAF